MTAAKKKDGIWKGRPRVGAERIPVLANSNYRKQEDYEGGRK